LFNSRFCAGLPNVPQFLHFDGFTAAIGLCVQLLPQKWMLLCAFSLRVMLQTILPGDTLYHEKILPQLWIYGYLRCSSAILSVKILVAQLRQEIKQGYHEKLREFHPDKRPNSQEGRGKKITAQLRLGRRGWGKAMALALAIGGRFMAGLWQVYHICKEINDEAVDF